MGLIVRHLKSYSYKPRSTLLILSAIGVLTSCTTPVTPDFTEMSASYANILEQYQLNSILINIIRASSERPLSFLDIPSINGSGNVTTSPSLNTSLSGFIGGIAGGPAGITSSSPSLSLSFGNSFNFSQSSLDNATFLRGFLSPIPVETAKFFISDNLPREVMFSLVIAAIEIKQPDGKSVKYINNPLLPEYPEFEAELYKLLSYGLTVDPVQEEAAKPPMPPARSLPGGRIPNNPMPGGGYNPSFPGMGSPYGGMGSPYGGMGGFGGGGMYGQSSPHTQYKFCVDENKFANFVKQEFSPGIFCRASAGSSNKKGSKAELILTLRSTHSVFEFLGQVVAAQNQAVPYMVTLPPSDTTRPRKAGQENQYALLVVNKNLGNSKSFASVKNLDGDIYSVPAENNGYSPMVIRIISQLLSLNKIPGSIPSSPGILLR
jgi:hypothetical protein